MIYQKMIKQKMLKKHQIRIIENKKQRIKQEKILEKNNIIKH